MLLSYPQIFPKRHVFSIGSRPNTHMGRHGKAGWREMVHRYRPRQFHACNSTTTAGNRTRAKPSHRARRRNAQSKIEVVLLKQASLALTRRRRRRGAPAVTRYRRSVRPSAYRARKFGSNDPETQNMQVIMETESSNTHSERRKRALEEPQYQRLARTRRPTSPTSALMSQRNRL